MFNNMKSKIREKTGSDLPKFSANTGSLFGKTKSNQHSRQSSQGSINSTLSDLSSKEDNDKFKMAPDSPKIVEDVKAVDYINKLAEKEKEWKEKEKEYVADLLKQTKELQEALALAEDNQKKLQCCLEEKEQLELYQKQEVTKIKQLLLEKEEENNSIGTALKEAESTTATLRQEMNLLRPLIEQVNDCQDDLECLRHTSEKERWNLTSQLTQKDEIIRHLEERITVLTHRTEADCQALGAQLSTDERVRSLVAERALLERRLEEAHIHLSEIKTSWSNKIAILETQVGRLCRQAGEEGTERRNAEKKISDLEAKYDLLSKEKQNIEKKVEKLTKERDNLATELKELSNVSEDKTFEELTTKLEVLSKENEALRLSNEESRRIYEETLFKEFNINNNLRQDLVRLKEYSEEIAGALEEEKQVKDKTLFRNAEISQLVQLTEQELKLQQTQNEELFKKIAYLEDQLESSQQNLKKLQTELNPVNSVDFNEKVKELENEIADKNKTIRILQQNLTDVKKTFQAELKNTANNNNNNCNNPEEDINFKYMKHVLIKFLTSSEYEAQQLTKAVATLLKLNSDEERLIKDTLEWRSSWFGSKPRVKVHYNPS